MRASSKNLRRKVRDGEHLIHRVRSEEAAAHPATRVGITYRSYGTLNASANYDKGRDRTRFRRFLTLRPGSQVGDDGVGFLREGEYRTPPAGVHTVITNRKEAKHGDHRNQGKRSQPAETLFDGFAAFHPFLANVGGEGGPAVGCRIDGGAFFVGCFEEAVSPIAGVKAEGAGVSTNDTFAEDATGKLLIAILLQRHQVALADLGDRQ